MSNSGDSIELVYAITASVGVPHTLFVNSPLWITTATHFADFSSSAPADVFAPPLICSHATRASHPAQANASHPTLVSLDTLQTNASDPAMSSSGANGNSTFGAKRNTSATPAMDRTDDLPPSFPLVFSSSLLLNISQPGYDGGNVFQNFSADCSRGPHVQKSKTT